MGRYVFSIVSGLLLLAICVTSSFAQECSINPKEYVLKVKGSGEFSLEPDSFSVVLVVESESGSIKSATKDNAKKISAIREKIEQLKVPSLEFSTSSFNFDRGEKAVFFGKKCKIENVVIVKAEKLKYDKLSDYASDVIDAAIANGATQARDFSYYLKDEDTAEQEAIKLAIGNAKSKALLSAKELNVTLSKPYVIDISVKSSNQLAVPVDSRGWYSEKTFGGESQVSPGKITYVAEVTAEYKFE